MQVEILSIEEIDEVDMLDIQVSGNNLFFANGILTHNSAIVATREDKSLGQDHIQGGISKINTADLVIALVKDEAMDAAGEYRFEFLKARNSNAVNKKLLMRWDAQSLRISDASSLQLVKGAAPGQRPSIPNMRPGSNPDGLQALLGRTP